MAMALDLLVLRDVPAPAIDRPRERLLDTGPESMSTVDLLAVVLGSGTRGRSAEQLARQLLEDTGGLADLARASPAELWQTRGVGAAQAARLVACCCLGRRAVGAVRPVGAAITSPDDVFARLRARLAGLTQELFIVVALDTRKRVIDDIEVARGCLTGVEVHPREVFRPLIRGSAAAAVVAHNHPSGDPTPSQDDVALTYRLERIGELVGIPILDHVVIAGSRFVSVRERLGAGETMR